MIAGVFDAFGDGTFESLVGIGKFFDALILGFGVMR
jgi:hypothetical protein